MRAARDSADNGGSGCGPSLITSEQKRRNVASWNQARGVVKLFHVKPSTVHLRVICYCVIFASSYASAGPLSLKQNCVFTLVITWGNSDPHTAHSTHIGSGAGYCSFC